MQTELKGSEWWTTCKCAPISTKHYRICSVCVSCKALKSYFSIYKNHVCSWWFYQSNRRCSVRIHYKADFLQSVFKEHLVSFLSSPLPVSCVWFPVRFTSALYVGVVNLWESNQPAKTHYHLPANRLYLWVQFLMHHRTSCLIKKNFPQRWQQLHACVYFMQTSAGIRVTEEEEKTSRRIRWVQTHLHHYRYQNTNAETDRLSCISKPEHTKSDSRLFVCNNNKASR